MQDSSLHMPVSEFAHIELSAALRTVVSLSVRAAPAATGGGGGGGGGMFSNQIIQMLVLSGGGFTREYRRVKSQGTSTAWENLNGAPIISSGYDLNNVQSAGTYFLKSAYSYLNGPADDELNNSGGYLIVFKTSVGLISGGMNTAPIMQEIKVATNGSTYRRANTTNSMGWTTWTLI
jgi:hypothetical protein